MKRFWDFISKYGFTMFVVLYLLLRDYPFGDTLQTVGDITLLVAIILSIISWVMKKKVDNVTGNTK
ncbi:hypothetical protein CHH58_05205 [Terribacillus saccharophilus]|nr:hypothetical protein CHH58_05205 [Terribacillus saccharophilus]